MVCGRGRRKVDCWKGGVEGETGDGNCYQVLVELCAA